MVCLDTNAVIELIRGNLKVLELLEQQPDNTLSITAVTRYELLKHSNLDKKKAAANVIKNFLILPFDEEASNRAAAIYEKLRLKGSLINENDILIAGTTLSANETLITTDKDFEKVEGLKTMII